MSASRANGHPVAALVLAALILAPLGAEAWAADETTLQRPTRLVPHSVLAPSGAVDSQPWQPPAQITPSALAQPSIQGIEVNPLDEIAPDSLGTLGPEGGGFGLDMWRGSERGVVARLMRRLPGEMRSPAMRNLARRLLLSTAAPPPETAGQNARSEANLLGLRVQQLAALGEVPALNQLLSVVPSGHDDEFISRTRVEGLLLDQDFDEACRRVRNGISLYHQVP